MTVLSINSNLASARAQRGLSSATDRIANVFNALASGQRITKASDDAAGLSIASSLSGDTRVYAQGVRNLNDGISALSIADSALSQLSGIVTRISELAAQAASGTLGSAQRKSLNLEAQQLSDEYTRIAKTTSFNGVNLFDGSVQGFRLQAGYGESGSIVSSLGGALGTGTFRTSVSYMSLPAGSATASALTDVDGDGNLDILMSGSGAGGRLHDRAIGQWQRKLQSSNIIQPSQRGRFCDGGLRSKRGWERRHRR